MNKRGQMGITIGSFIGIFVLVVVGLALFQGSAGQVGGAINSATASNTTITMPADGVVLDLEGQNYLSGFVMTNATGGEVVPATNYTIGEGVSTSTGVLSVQLTGAASTYSGTSVNVSYEYGPDGYISSSGSRGVAGIILIFFALAIAVVALSPTLRSKILKMK